MDALKSAHIGEIRADSTCEIEKQAGFLTVQTLAEIPIPEDPPKDSPLNGKLVMIHGTDVVDSMMNGFGSTTIDGEVSG